MSSGELRERISFWQLAEADSSFGIVAGEYEEQFRRAARIKSMQGSEPVIAQRLTGVNPVEITVRSDSSTRDVDESWKVVNTRTLQAYNIRSVVPDERRKYIRIIVELGPATNA